MIYLNSKLLNQVKHSQDNTDFLFTEISFKKFSSRKKNLTPALSKREGVQFLLSKNSNY